MRCLILLLISSSLIASDINPVVVVAVSNEPITVGLKQAIELGWADGGSEIPIEKYVTVDGSEEGMRVVAQEMIRDYPDRPLILFANWHMRELKAASRVFNKSKENTPYRFAISSGSLERVLPPNTASSAPSLTFATMASHLYAQAMQSAGVIIIHGKRTFAVDYVDSFKSQAESQGTKITGIFEIPEVADRETLLKAMKPVFEALKKSPSPTLLLWVNDAVSLEEIAPEIQQLPTGTRVLCSPLADGLHDRFGNIPVAVVVPSILDNTSTTAHVTEDLHAKKELGTSHLAWCVWNGYDGARAISTLVQRGKPVTLENLSTKVDAATPPAALGPSWFDAKTGRSPYGFFWIINVHDEMIKPSDLPEFRRRTNGAIFTLPDSAGCVAQVGHVPWIGTFPWAIQTYRWQKMINQKTQEVTIKHSVEILSKDPDLIFSNAEMTIPLFLKGDRVCGYRLSDLPDCEAQQALVFPYPLPSYTMHY